MQLTRFTDYSLRVLMFLAYREGELCTIAEIATTYRVSENHLMKVVHQLARLGYVSTLRGKGGGLRLGRPPERIGLGDVVRDVEETLAVVECMDGRYESDCLLLPHCRLKGVLHEAQDSFLAVLDRYTVRDLIEGSRPPAAVIRFVDRPPPSPSRRRSAP